MPAVELRISPRPEHVRTARLVATAVARSVGVHESLLEEIRLVVGEVCSLVVGLHQGAGLEAPVLVALTSEEGQLLVEVTADRRVQVPGPPKSAPDEGAPSYEPDVLALTLIKGLASDVEFVETPHGTLVRMRWPASPPSTSP
ncbi:ATP-binding protein [Streptomyces sp. NPDC055815]